MQFTLARAVALFAIGAVALAAAPAAAQTIAGKAAEAETLAKAGKFADALVALDAAADILWEKSPLACRRILWVADKASGFGAYNPRETNVYKSGETMLAYAEPIGYGWRKSGDIWHIDMVGDLVIRSADGAELFRKDDFGAFAIASRARNREFMLNLTVTLSGVSPGNYVAETVLRDKVSGKEGTPCRLPFVIAP